jgi:membrane-associated protease RseP (regulator of RpoE activity)
MLKPYKDSIIQISLFIMTFITTTLAGAEWVYGKFVLADNYSWNDFYSGMHFSIPFLAILTVHEFGHYFTARWHKVKASLPYYLPCPPSSFFFFLSIGTFGAVIRIRDFVRSNVQHFDIGIAGPLAGFVLTLGVLGYGYSTLPPAEYIFTIHPEYEKHGLAYADHVYTMEPDEHGNVPIDIQIGSNLLLGMFETFVADPSRIPNPREFMHYPYLFAGFLALLFTSMNLLPIGQLDGGHVTYGLFGYKGHHRIATVAFITLLGYAGLGLVDPSGDPNELVWLIPMVLLGYYFCFRGVSTNRKDRITYALALMAIQIVITWLFPAIQGYPGWLVFAFVISRFGGIAHPRSLIEIPLDSTRTILGWLALLIFILSFSPTPIIIQ